MRPAYGQEIGKGEEATRRFRSTILDGSVSP